MFSILPDLWQVVGVWSALEWVAVGFGVACVWLTRRESIWCWPTGLVNIGLLLVLFLRSRLYIDVGLQVVMTVLSIYGWIAWSRPRAELPIRRLRRLEAVVWAAVMVAGAGLAGALFGRFTDQAVPCWNAATVVLQLIAQFLMARKVLENWTLWILADALMIGEYAWVGLYEVTAQFALFLVLAVLGYIEWKKRLAAV
jgi:nicotinamide mononucleotide transporter